MWLRTGVALGIALLYIAFTSARVAPVRSGEFALEADDELEIWKRSDKSDEYYRE